MTDDIRITEATEAFVRSVPEGGYYVLSREGNGFALSGDAGEDARSLADANFQRLAAAEARERQSR